MKKLVAYFSASGTTAEVSERLAEAIGADLFEIKPEVPYSAKDLNWKNPLARCNKEKFGGKSVPVKVKVKNMDEYDAVFIGFPIWYGIAPNVVGTFAEDYDWSGKKVVIFATSGGSGMGRSDTRLLEHMQGNPEIVESRLVSSSADRASLKKWADSLF